ncbi:hypothetical protein [Agromyces neolithicus]|uniref:Uncharacterized protein n=1 Tax=Agromyces neolithicus TaxID=269420 RepID=A0ABN2M7W7_9MICO
MSSTITDNRTRTPVDGGEARRFRKVMTAAAIGHFVDGSASRSTPPRLQSSLALVVMIGMPETNRRSRRDQAPSEAPVVPAGRR